MLQSTPIRKHLRSTLEINPNLNHHEWRQEALSLLSSRSRARYNLGLFHHGSTQAEWNTENPPTLDNNGVLQEVPYPPASVIPPELPGNAGGAAVSARERIVKEHIAEIDSLEEAKDILLDSIGIDNIRLVSHFVQAPEILQLGTLWILC